MTDNARPSEDSPDETALLLAYADDQLDGAARIEVEQRLQSDPAARALLAQLEASALPLRAAYEALTPAMPAKLNLASIRAAHSRGGEPLAPQDKPVGDLRALTPRKARWQPWAAAAALALAVGLGYTAGKRPGEAGMQVPTVAAWVQQVINYQLLYARETVAGPSPAPAARSELAGRLGQWLGDELIIPDLAAQALDFKRGQPLTLGDRPLVQLVYLAPTGGPLALCITTADSAETQLDASYESGDAGPMRYASWRHDGLDYLLVGTQNLAVVEHVAEAARAQL